MIKKYNTLNVRLTKQEVEEFRNIAIEIGMTQADLIRKRVLQQGEIIDTLSQNHEDLKNKIADWLDWYITENIENLEEKIVSKLQSELESKSEEQLNKFTEELKRQFKLWR